MSFLGGTPVTSPRSQARSGQDGVPPRLGWGTLIQDRTEDGVLATRRAVCLLRSRRRTSLFYDFLPGFINGSLCFFACEQFCAINVKTPVAAT